MASFSLNENIVVFMAKWLVFMYGFRFLVSWVNILTFRFIIPPIFEELLYELKAAVHWLYICTILSVFNGQCVLIAFPCRLVQRTKSPNPSLRLQARVEENTSGIYISSNNSAHNQYQNWANRNMYRQLTKEIRAWRVWEVLDEGVGGSLKTHL